MMIEHLKTLTRENTIAITVQHYGSSSNDVQLGVLPYFILAAAWFNDKIAININVIDKHLFDMREKMITELPGGDRLYSKIRALEGISHFDMIAVCKYPDGRNNGLNAGQKITPVTSLAIASPHDVSFAIWREVYINEIVSELVMNNVCTGFAYSAGWFYIYGADDQLYDGIASRSKYKNSANALASRTSMLTARESTLTNDNRYPSDDPRHDIQSPINNQFAMLHSMLTGDIKFTDTHLIMSSFAICALSTHTNVTVSNAHLLAYTNPTSGILSDSGFGRLLFDYLYDLYCLNTRVRAMQGDLHISNATMMRLNIATKAEYGNTAYVIGEDIYSLPYGGVIGCIIDFSRAIIGDTDRLANEYTRASAGMVQTSQVQMLADLVRRHFPAIHSAFASNLRIIAEDKFDAFFQVCTIIDAYSLSCGIGIMFDTQPEYRRKYALVSPELRDLVQRITYTSRDIFIRNMNTLMRTGEPPTKWPMLELIEAIYGDKRITWPPSDDEPVSHVVNSNNPIKYTRENLNPLVDPTEEMKIRKEIGIERREQTFEMREIAAQHAAADAAEIDAIAKKYAPTEYEHNRVMRTTGGGACPCGCILGGNDTDDYICTSVCLCDPDDAECNCECQRCISLTESVIGGNDATTYGQVLL
jgi:hypothetical protein